MDLISLKVNESLDINAKLFDGLNVLVSSGQRKKVSKINVEVLSSKLGVKKR